MYLSLSLSLYLSLSLSFFGHFMSLHHSNQMSQRSQVSWVALCISISKVPWVSDSVSEWVTRSPIELFWTAKNGYVIGFWKEKRQTLPILLLLSLSLKLFFRDGKTLQKIHWYRFFIFPLLCRCQAFVFISIYGQKLFFPCNGHFAGKYNFWASLEITSGLLAVSDRKIWSFALIILPYVPVSSNVSITFYLNAYLYIIFTYIKHLYIGQNILWLWYLQKENAVTCERGQATMIGRNATKVQTAHHIVNIKLSCTPLTHIKHI